MSVLCPYGFNAGEICDDGVDSQTSWLFMNNSEDFTGYTLFAPLSSTTTYLINNNGDVIHTWDSDYIPTCSVYLLENGVLLRASKFSNQIRGFQKIAWNGTILSEFEYPAQHHDIEPLPNGNVLMITTETITSAEAVAAGRNPSLLYGDTLKTLVIVEVEPDGSSGGNVVWKWHVLDHLIQDFDVTKENYGAVADHPELIDFNFVGEGGTSWIHTNSIDYNEEFDQILVSSRNLHEIWVIDHSTTTAEAANHTGGNSGKGGDLLYRWGNPQAYRAGDENDKQFSGQHDAQWIEDWCPGAGNFLVFNNGIDRNYASVDEIVPPVDSNGNYSYVPGSAYEPEEPIWICTSEGLHPLVMSGAQRLPTGNTLICDAPQGYFFEVTPEQEKVWEYVNPYPNPSENNVFKIRRYYEPFIENIPTLNPTEDELYILNLSSIITDPDTSDENLVLNENSSYAELVEFELHLLYPPGVTYDVINLSVSDTTFMVSQDIQVEIIPETDILLDGYCYYPTMDPVNLVSVEIINMNTSQKWQADTVDNYYSLVLRTGRGINASETLRLIARDDNESVNVTDCEITLDDINTGYIHIDLHLNLHYRDLVTFPWYQSEIDTGATTMKMMLDYLMWNSTIHSGGPPDVYDEQDLYDNYSGGDYINASELAGGLNNEIPGEPDWEYGYSFVPWGYEDVNESLKRICVWVDYPVNFPSYMNWTDREWPKPGHPNHVPVAIPFNGTYDHWVAVRGIHTNKSAWQYPDFPNITIYGFWINDPASDGIGGNTYVTVEKLTTDYYLQIDVPGDWYDNQFVSVTDPPNIEGFELPEYNEKEVTFVEAPGGFLKREAKIVRKAQVNRFVRFYADNFVIDAAFKGAENVLKYSHLAEVFTESKVMDEPIYNKDECEVNFVNGNIEFIVAIGSTKGELRQIQVMENLNPQSIQKTIDLR